MLFLCWFVFISRLEMLQQIANRVQRDCVSGEDKLSLARTALQSVSLHFERKNTKHVLVFVCPVVFILYGLWERSFSVCFPRPLQDAKRLEAGIQFQNEAEIAGYLLECENTLRQQVVEIQMLLDGKFPFADQLVQRYDAFCLMLTCTHSPPPRETHLKPGELMLITSVFTSSRLTTRVSKLRDDLLSLRTECSSVYNQGRTLTAEQTKRMISGISNSLNFTQSTNPSLSPALTPGGATGAGATFTSSSLGPALTPGLQPQSMLGSMGGDGGGMEPMSLQSLKHTQIPKPLGKSSLLDANMTEEEANMNFVQDLLNWVEEMQVRPPWLLCKQTLTRSCPCQCCGDFLSSLIKKQEQKYLMDGNCSCVSEGTSGPWGVGHRFTKCGNANRQFQKCS